MPKLTLSIVLSISLLAASCASSKGGSDTPAESAKTQLTAQPTAAEQSSIVKIVFVGQKDACECTRERIDTTWTSLLSALGQNKDIVVERIQRDVEEATAEKLGELRPLMVAPGLYFFNQHEDVVEMLQGEVSSDEILEQI